MTQLNLLRQAVQRFQQKPVTKHEDESIANQTVGALGALAMFAAVIVVGSCTGSSNPVAMKQPAQPTAPISAPVLAAPRAPSAVSGKASATNGGAATLSYVNRDYGLSFNFPRGYVLKTGKKAQEASADDGTFNELAHPGGVTLAAVECPPTPILELISNLPGFTSA